jgi:predicted transcriptional regulator
MSRKLNVHVGTMEDLGRRFVSAWRRLENEEKVRERHLTFEDLPGLLNALTPRRLELLREVRREAAPSVRALAGRLNRDYKRVHGDVHTLSALGLLVRDGSASRHPTTLSRATSICASWRDALKPLVESAQVPRLGGNRRFGIRFPQYKTMKPRIRA